LRHFQKIAEGVDVIPILNALSAREELWNENDLRSTHPASPHGAVDDIWVFFNDPSNAEAVVNDLDVVSYRGWRELPQLRPLVFDIMRRVEAVKLGRVIITRLPPGKEIPPHIDQGAPATYFTRYMLALQCLPGAIFTIESEVVNFRMGEWWMIDNRTEHSVVNNSADDRIVLIVDLRLE